jgi:3-oxoacyl-[acyl-carrier protein] reductase
VDITEETFHAHYNINVLVSIVTVQEAVKRFGSDGGSIINISSIVASHPNAWSRALRLNEGCHGDAHQRFGP